MIGIGKDVSKVYDISVIGMSGRIIHKGGEIERSRDFVEFIDLLLPENIFVLIQEDILKAFLMLN